MIADFRSFPLVPFTSGTIIDDIRLQSGGAMEIKVPGGAFGSDHALQFYSGSLDVDWRPTSVLAIRIWVAPFDDVTVEFFNATGGPARPSETILQAPAWERRDYVVFGCERLRITNVSTEAMISLLEVIPVPDTTIAP